MIETPDVLVVGAGPAGLAAAAAAVGCGAEVVLLDAADDVGGQYWRHLPPARPAAREHLLQHDGRRFDALRAAVSGRTVTQAQVWLVERPDEGGPPVVHVLVGPADGAAREHRVFAPRALVLATGAAERTLPFPGWELPGVFTAGAAQALAKGERVAVGRRVLVTGTGPFLLPVATSLTHTGAQVLGVLEATGWGGLARGWTARPHELLPFWRKAGELAGYAGHLARHRIPYRTATGVVAAHGVERLEAVTVARLDARWAPVPGTARRIAVDAVCVGHGFVPRTELAVAAGCALAADGTVLVDARGRTSVPGVHAAGEITGIGGAAVALAEGSAAGAAAAGAAAGAARGTRRYSRFGGRLAAVHGIGPHWTRWLTDDTLVCRCEEVTVGELRAAAEATDARGLRSLKLCSRAGLGACQGRVCGPTVEELAGRASGGLLDAGRTATRPVAAFVRLGELARMTPPEEAS